ncbi:FkbM family methyltransferase [Methyloceanibacter sp.]|uniref:FkbM family methyltransferase n=1 Tax=Methyloceanibacter sp. TaxID=1965321 RepID=UPI002B87C161|nr:FkbM family methyltransferase [Methyloceanibacter sp.]HML91653.1 FkbM family methyltransferase [Methyloceanibacter sp.]
MTQTTAHEPGTAPVALFVYNRADHAQATIEALRANVLASETDLHVFSDGPKSDVDREGVDAVRTLLKDIEGFRSVTVNARAENIGLAQSIIGGVTEIVERHGRVIVIEDDLVTHPATLTYFNRMLDRFENHAGVFSIGAYSHPASVMPVPADYGYDVYAIPRMQCWGWATWRDRWAKADFAVPEFDAFNASASATAAYAHWIGADSLATLRACMRGEKDVWACRWVYTHFKHHAVCICPTQSLVDNTGLDGSGSNCGVRPEFKHTLETLKIEDWRTPDLAFVDPRLFEAFMAVMDPRRRHEPMSGSAHRGLDPEPRPSMTARAAYWARRPRQLLRRVRERTGFAGGAHGPNPSEVEARHRALAAPPSSPLIRLGTDYGGWWVPEKGLSPDDVVVSAGAGEDISFDVELAKRFGCRLIVLDPTPRAISHFEATKEAIAAGRPAPINNSKTEFYDAEDGDLERIAFRPWGLWNETETLTFHPPANAGSVSHSAVNLQNTDGGFDAECVTLEELMRREGIENIRVLKMDIEGAEFAVIDRLVHSALRPRILLVEFHPGDSNTERLGKVRTLATLRKLHDEGYRLVRYRGWDYALEYQDTDELSRPRA